MSGGPLAEGELVLVSVEDGATRTVGGSDVPSSDTGFGRAPPRWSPDGTHLYAVRNGELWRVDAGSGRAERVAGIAGWRIAAIVAPFERLGKPVEFRLYRGEGHVITQKPNVIDFWERRLEFLAEHLDLVRDDDGAVRARSVATSGGPGRRP